MPGSRLDSVSVVDGFPVVLQPTAEVEPASWASRNRAAIGALLADKGAVLLRGFPVTDVAGFRAVSSALASRLLDYVNRSTPRKTVGDAVYTATEYPASETIPLHNENSYQREWPMKLCFFCKVPPDTGGATPLARTVDVTRRISATTCRAFAERGVLYQRNYYPRLGLPWQVAFQTEDKATVEAFCRDHQIQFQWLDSVLRTRQVVQGTARHPVTGQEVWFNQAHLFHASAVAGPGTAMLDRFDEDEYPRHAYYGDGAPIEPATLDEIRDAFERETVAFPWQRGDVLVIDNMLASHGREPFTGPREVLVCMADLHSPGPLLSPG